MCIIKTVYKHTNIAFIESSIKYGVFASPINSVNDPYEWYGIRYSDDYRICCMTEKNRKMLMWSYYGNHRGCLIEFELPKIAIDSGVIKRVSYIKEYIDHSTLSAQELVNSLYVKYHEWSHEQEIRAVYYRDNANTELWIKSDDEHNVYLKAKVKSVTFGLYSEKEPNYYNVLIRLRTHNLTCNDKDKIVVQKVMLNNNQYRLTDDKQYDYLKELRLAEL